MIVTNKFVFIHMHKTGGQSLNNAIINCMPSHQFIGYHFPKFMLPGEFSHLPIVGIVRNPWEWYVSWYAFNIRDDIHNPLFYVLSDGGIADFKRTVTNLINIGSDSKESKQYRFALTEILPKSLEENSGVGLTKGCIQYFNDNDTGYYTWLFKRMHGDLNKSTTHIGRFENLEEDFLSIIENLSVEEIDCVKSKFSFSPHLNSSKHSHYSCYYDDELKELIQVKEKQLIKLYDYEFNDQSSQLQVVQFPNSKTNVDENSFQKLLGKDSNFHLLKTDFDVEPLRTKLLQVPESTWNLSGREKRFEAHRHTQSLMLIYDEDFRHFNPTTLPLYEQFKVELAPLIKLISDYYQHNGFIIRIIFAKLKANSKIAAHCDMQYSLMNCHRIHIPIITDEQSEFMVGGELKNIKVGEICEINNSTVHSVNNKSAADRTHLIIDWVPHSTVRPEDKIIKADSGSTVDANAQSDDSKFMNLKIGRNESCPCGSGKKYKKCHGKIG